eukprot:353077-Chlamydomonas_euryale.AAC.11
MASKKIIKEKGAAPDEFEESVAQVRAEAVGHCKAGDALHLQPCCVFSHVIKRVEFNQMRFLQALFDLEATNQELKADLRDLYITGAREVDVHGANRKSVVVHVSHSPCYLCERLQQAPTNTRRIENGLACIFHARRAAWLFASMHGKTITTSCTYHANLSCAWGCAHCVGPACQTAVGYRLGYQHPAHCCPSPMLAPWGECGTPQI